MSRRPFIVGISGASCSGKTTLAHRLASALKPRAGEAGCSVINADSYYRGLQPGEDAAERNWDHPSSLDLPLLASQLAALHAGGEAVIAVPAYDFAVHARSAEAAARISARATAVLLVDGLFVLSDEGVRRQCDLSIFCAAEPDVCLARRLARDVAERGRSAEGVLAQYARFVRRGVREIIAPAAAHADIVVNCDEGPSEAAVALLAAALQARVEAGGVEL